MKIGILTWHYLDNYGSLVQAYALKKTLDGLGHEVQIINYRKEAKTDFLHNLLRAVRGHMPHLPNSDLNRVKKFYQFQQRYLNQTAIFSSLEDIEDWPEKDGFDAFICGSDQIWASTRFDQAYFLPWSNSINIAYAPSCVVRNFTDEQEAFIKTSLARFRALSTRESSGSQYIAHLTGRVCETVLDPSLLLSRDDYREIEIDSEEAGYVLCLLIGEQDKYSEQVIEYANGRKIINIATTDRHQFGELRMGEGLGELLGLIKNADTFVTDSYHGILLSLIYQKEFFALKRFEDQATDNQNDRVENILRKLGLSERYVDSTASLATDFIPIDYSFVERVLAKEKQASLAFLDNNLRD